MILTTICGMVNPEELRMFHILYKTVIVPVNRVYYGVHCTNDIFWGTPEYGVTDGFYGSHNDITAWQKRHGNSQLITSAIHAFTDASEANRMLQRYLPPIVKSAETRQKISVAQTGSNNNFYGATHAPETLKVLSEHRKGIKWINDGQKEKQIPKMDSIPYGWKAGRLKRK